MILRGLDEDICEKHSNHAFTYFIINSLVSYSMSIMLEKINVLNGKKILKKFIKELIASKEILNAARQYRPSEKESKWIPKAILTKSIFLIEFACNIRCKEILRKSRKK